MARPFHLVVGFLAVGALSACGTTDAGSGSDSAEPPRTYAFKSRFGPGSSVSYGGQTFRQVLIKELSARIAALGATSYKDPKKGDVVRDLLFYFDFKGQGGTATEPLTLTLPGSPKLLQKTHGDIGSPASLAEKMADKDAGFSRGVAGWKDGKTLPTPLVRSWFEAIERIVIARIQDGKSEKDPAGKAIEKLYVSSKGLDYRELIEKFLLGAVAFSQAADDYLDDDKPQKGLLSDNTKAVTKSGAKKPYTALEHAWDEAFGYFGAARDYLDYTDDEIAGKGGRPGYARGYHDTNGDGAIDLRAEVNFGASVNAAKRDRASKAGIDLTGQAMRAFLAGRHLITTTAGALDQAARDKLKRHRDAALLAWEKAIAATMVHYINEVLVATGRFGEKPCAAGQKGTCYDFLGHAKAWSELKGFALSLQFNPRNAISDADLAKVHKAIGDRPLLPKASPSALSAHQRDLRDARAILGRVYGFDRRDLGDDSGKNGW